jgi:hypothetical protein
MSSRLSHRQRVTMPLLLGLSLAPALTAEAAQGATTAATPTGVTRLAATDATSSAARATGCRRTGSYWLAGGACRWTTTLTFRVPAGSYDRASLSLKLGSKSTGTMRIRAGAGSALSGKELDSAKSPKGTVPFNVFDVVKASAGSTITFVVESTSSSPSRFKSPKLELRYAADQGPTPGAGGGTGPKPIPTPQPPTPQPPAPQPPVPPAPTPQPGPQPLPPTSTGAVWLTQTDVRALPMSGAGWNAVKSAADGSFGSADIANQDSDHDVDTLAAALVFARTGDAGYRSKVNSAISSAIGTEAGGRTLALARNLNPYVLAADLIDLRTSDPALDQRFRTWLQGVRTANLQGLTLISTHEKRPNNWGTMAGASRIAADLYLGDTSDLAKATAVFRGYLGDRAAYAGFAWGDLSYQADSSKPVGINPPGAAKSGVDIDGAIPDDMRRGCAFQSVPCHTNYAWEALQGVVVQAELLSRHGQPAFAWSANAILRAAKYLDRLDNQYGGWWAASDDKWQPWIINHAYGTSFPASHGGPGKVMGWTDWVYGG